MSELSLGAEVHIFTFVCLLMMFLGLQMQVSKMNKKIDQLLQQRDKPKTF